MTQHLARERRGRRGDGLGKVSCAAPRLRGKRAEPAGPEIYLCDWRGEHGTTGRTHHHVILNAVRRRPRNCLSRSGYAARRRPTSSYIRDTRVRCAGRSYLTKEPREAGPASMAKSMWTPSKGSTGPRAARSPLMNGWTTAQALGCAAWRDRCWNRGAAAGMSTASCRYIKYLLPKAGAEAMLYKQTRSSTQRCCWLWNAHVYIMHTGHGEKAATDGVDKTRKTSV